MIEITQEEIIKDWKSNDIVVSINTLTYNHEKYIAQCIEGILSQKTNFAFELLIHDDASTDRTAEIIREYEEKYPLIIKPIYQTENQWAKGIKNSVTYQYPRAKGKYIALCEGDDYWTDENKLQMQVDFLENNPDYGMCFHSAKFEVIGNHSVPDKLQNIEDRDFLPTEIFETWTIPTASVVFDRRILHYSMKNEENIMFGDIILFEKCAHLGKVRGISSKMSVYRVHEQGVSHNKSLLNKRRMKFPKHYECIYENFPKIDERVVLKKIIRSYFSCLIYCGNFIDKLIYLKSIFKFSFKLIFQRCKMVGSAN